MNSGIEKALTRAGWVTVAALAIGCLFLSRSVSGSRVARAANRIAPFTLETAVYTFGRNATGELLDKRTEARRSDGSEVLITSVLGRLGIRAGARARKVSFADGRTITLDDSIAAKTTWPRKPSEQANRLGRFFVDAPADCIYDPGETLLSYSSVLGERTAVVRELQFADGGNQELTKWRAVALGCKTLKYRLEAKNPDGSRRLLSEAKPLGLKLGEPAASLFDTGESYAELKPSELWPREARYVGIAWNPGEEIEQRKDAIYLGVAAPFTKVP